MNSDWTKHREEFIHTFHEDINIKWFWLWCLWLFNFMNRNLFCWFQPKCYIVTYVDSHLHTCTYICRITHNDTTTKTDAWRKEAGRKTQEDFFRKIFISLFIVRVRKGCWRVCMWEDAGETERKLHILTPLLWPSRCVFIVLLMLGSTPSGLSEGPLGRVWLFLPHLVSTVWKSAGNCIGGFRGPPRSGVAFPTTSRL